MKLGRKLTYAKQHVESITRHDDEPLTVRLAVLADLRAHIDAEVTAAEGREAARVAAATRDTTA